MKRWLCGVVVWLASGCVNLSTPSELNRQTVDAVAPEGDDSGTADADIADAEIADATQGDDLATAVDAGSDDVAPPPDDLPLPPPDLVPLQPDATEPDAPLVINGHPCSMGGQCQSGFCVDSVCCSGDCTGVCQACNVPGSLGTCAPVSAGQDPDNECPQDPVSTCGRDGTCNGQGACRRYLEGTECAPSGCTGSDEHAASTCNGAGACIPGKTVSCSPHMCMNGSCATTCAQQTDCLTGFYCDGSACRSQHALGDPCANGYECASGHCVDKVCCNTACTESCHSCALTGAVGTCTTTPTGLDPRNECPADAATTCERAGGCDGRGGCRLYVAGTPCGAGTTCTNDVQTAPSTCNGLGVCLPGATQDCGTYHCGATSCNTSCVTPAQCKAGNECTAALHLCIPLPPATLYWKFDESSGTTATDSSGNKFNGTYIGSSGTPSPSTMVPRLQFPDPSSRAFVRANRQAVQLANAPAAIEPASDLTVTLWYRATTIDTGPPGSAAGSELLSAGDNYLVRLHMGDIELSKNEASGHTMCLSPLSNHLDGNWHHVAAVFSATAMTLYFDGVMKMSCPDSGPIAYTRGKDLFVGRHGNDTANSGYYDFEGNMDDVRIYARSLTPTQIAALAAGN